MENVPAAANRTTNSVGSPNRSLGLGRLVWTALGVLTGVVSYASATEPPQPNTAFDAVSAEYVRDIRPLMERFCLDCHSTELQKGELDLERFAALTDVRRAPRVWLKVI